MILTLFGACSGALAAAPSIETTAFPNDKYVALALASVDQDCKQAPTTLSVTAQGTQGQAAAWTVNAIYADRPECGDKTFPWNVVYYTWTSNVPTALSDTVPVSSSIDGGAPAPANLKIKIASAQVQSVDMKTGYVYLNFNGSSNDTQAMVDLEFIRSDGVVSKQSGTTYLSPGNGIKIQIDRPKIPKGTYNKLRVTLRAMTLRPFSAAPVPHTVSSEYTPPKAWEVLGVIKYTRYNVPAEAGCSGSPQQAYIVDSVPACAVTLTTLKSDFVAQAANNGTGKSQSYGFVMGSYAASLSTRCAGKLPADATLSNTFLKVSTVTGKCGVPLIPDVSVATYEVSPKVNCGMTLALVDRSTKATFQANRSRDDLCPKCKNSIAGVDGHIDSFSGSERCSGDGDAGDLGIYWTVRTN